MEREKKCKSKRPRKGKEEKDRYKKDGFIDDYMAAEQTLNESAITRNLFIIGSKVWHWNGNGRSCNDQTLGPDRSCNGRP